jgi:YD repeat-containing protein
MKKCFSKLLLLFSLLITLCVVLFATANAETYTYDSAGRLIKADYDDGKTIEYTYDNAGNPLQRRVTVPLPDIALSTNFYDFGNVEEGSQSPVQTFTASNQGNADLTIGTLTLDDTINFTRQNDQCSNQTLVSGQSCTLEIVFKPSSIGSVQTKLHIPSNDPNTAGLEVQLSGTGLALQRSTLQAQKDGTGTGTITSNPAGIDCGSDCTQVYDKGTDVTMTATPDSSSIFDGWSGGGCTGIATCMVTMDADKTVTASFDSVVTTMPLDTVDGTVTIDTSSNTGTYLTNVYTISATDPSLNQTGKPSNYEFNNVLIGFKVNGVNLGGTIQAKITFPFTISSGAKYYKVDSSGFHEFPNAVFSGDTATLTLTDGGNGDGDGTANGEIDDPGGVASPITPSTSTPTPSGGSGGGGGGGCAMSSSEKGNKDTFISLMGIFVVGLFLRRRMSFY